MLMPITPSELKEAVERSFKIPGLYRRTEAAFLYKLARRKGQLLEIGCWQGRTTSILVQAAAVWGATVTTVDPFTPMPARHKQSSPELWRSNLRKIGLTPPNLIALPSHEAGPLAPAELALVFIDGDHTREAVIEDLLDWTPRVQVGGVVALHDMFYPSIPGVVQSVATWWASYREQWEFIGLADFTVAFKRTA